MFKSINLHPLLSKSLNNLGFLEPTPVQAEVLPLALNGQDLLISAETGSGKTLSYLLPLLHSLLSQKVTPQSGSRSLVLLPTRELALQTFKLCNQLTQYTRLNAVLVTGGQESNYQAAVLRKDPDIIIATPGRLLQMLRTKAAYLDDIIFAVLDEADRMLDMGFREDVLDIIGHTSPERQTLLLSATLKHQGVGRIGDEVLKSPKSIALSSAQDKHSNIQQQLILSDDPEHKLKLIKTLIAQGTTKRVLIFANKRSKVNELCDLLKSCASTNKLHGEMRQDDRKTVVNAFRYSKFNVLVATDVAARGLDIDDIDLVINFDMPHSGDEYVHRVGRTGRAGKTGLAISLVSPNDWNLSESIQRYLKQRFEKTSIKGLEASYKGPNKLAAKKRKKINKAKAKAAPKAKSNTKKTKNKTPAKENIKNTGGFSPPKRPIR